MYYQKLLLQKLDTFQSIFNIRPGVRPSAVFQHGRIMFESSKGEGVRVKNLRAENWDFRRCVLCWRFIYRSGKFFIRYFQTTFLRRVSEMRRGGQFVFAFRSEILIWRHQQLDRTDFQKNCKTCSAQRQTNSFSQKLFSFYGFPFFEDK